MSPDLVEAVIQHIDRLRRAGLPTGPGAQLVPNVRGGRISRQRVARIVREAADAATAAVEAKGLPPLPHITPTACAAPTSPSRCWPTAST